MKIKIPRLAQAFLGEWEIIRVIDDHTDGEWIVFEVVSQSRKKSIIVHKFDTIAGKVYYCVTGLVHGDVVYIRIRYRLPDLGSDHNDRFFKVYRSPIGKLFLREISFKTYQKRAAAIRS